jgi:hypothetical protein
VAHVLWVVYRHGVLLPGAAAILPLVLLIFHLIRIWFTKQGMRRFVPGRIEKAKASEIQRIRTLANSG